MDLRRLLLNYTIIFISAFSIQHTNGCQPQVCRRRRSVTDATVKLNLNGCSRAGSPPWVRQVAYCLELPAAKMALNIKDWYRAEYQSCKNNGCSSYVSGDKSDNAIKDCVRCWKDKLSDAPYFGNVNRTDVEDCIDKYVPPFLNNELPILKPESRFKSHIDLPEARPAEYWWSVTVKLPCKPKLFVYWNAYCANSFAEDLEEGDYLLVQNNLVTAERITFFVEFSPTCSFDANDITVLWNESFPAKSVAQLSSFPSQIPPSEEERTTLFYDPAAAKRLRKTDQQIPAEWKIARQSSKKTRIKRQAPSSRLGLLFPCAVKSFKGADSDTKSLDLSGAGERYLLDVGSAGFRLAKQGMNFTINFGYNETGCIFDSSEVTVVPDPQMNWLDKDQQERYDRLQYNPKRNEINCTTCVNMENDLDCLHRGVYRVCAKGEICQTEVRQIRNKLQLITKSCKQKNACKTEALLAKEGQCRPGEAGSVCRCCCGSDTCNSGNNPCNL